MSPFLRVLRLLVSADPWSLARGALLSVVVLAMGASLLGLSGWFITATGIAGLAGLGATFEVFQPSAGVRGLALGRAVARYGERLLTHDATLRALAALRVAILRSHATRDARALASLRSESVLTRIVADVDALDGIVLRLVLPALAAIVTLLLALVSLAWFAGWPVALAVAGGYLVLVPPVLWRLARRSMIPSAEGEADLQSLRRAMIDTIRDREALILSGQLTSREAGLRDLDRAARQQAEALDRSERNAGAALTSLTAIIAALAIVTSAAGLASGRIAPAIAAIGLFVALALAEAVPTLVRGFADLGRMVSAATRVADAPPMAEPGTATEPVPGAALLTIHTAGLEVTLDAGEALALTGPSGSGKTTLLMQIAGLQPGEGMRIAGHPPRDWEETAFRNLLTVVPQRSALVSGSIRDNLSLAGPASDSELWKALEAVDLAAIFHARDGLDTKLGEAGSGLSGGQAKRLALARAILRKPQVLLLDEPTEGLDAPTAAKVLHGVRETLPETAILAALHRGADHEIFSASIRLGG